MGLIFPTPQRNKCSINSHYCEMGGRGREGERERERGGGERRDTGGGKRRDGGEKGSRGNKKQ
jgi:hypothetical protein